MPQILGAALVILLGLLVLWWARASRRGTLRRQWLLGYRTALTLRDARAWTVVHKATAPFLFTGGAGAVAAGLIAGVLALVALPHTAVVLLAAGIVWALLWVLLSFVPAAAAARTYAREHARPSS